MRCKRAFQFRPPHRGSRSAFTLIELLVVISIVVMLMALLLPSLQRGAEAGPGLYAARPTCVSGASSWQPIQAEHDRFCRRKLPGELGSDPLWYWEPAPLVYHHESGWKQFFASTPSGTRRAKASCAAHGRKASEYPEREIRGAEPPWPAGLGTTRRPLVRTGVIWGRQLWPEHRALHLSSAMRHRRTPDFWQPHDIKESPDASTSPSCS